MANDYFNTLMNDPMFTTGLSLFGASSPRNAPILQALQSYQAMNKNKREEERANTLMEYERQKTEMLRQQMQQAAVKDAQQQALMQEVSPMLRQAMQGFGGQPPAQQPEPQQIQPPQMAPPMGAIQNPQVQPNFFNQRIIPQESGGKQFRAPGIPLISSAGAVGIAQVMPKTGPEAARLAGLPWDEKALYNDPQYNYKLGEAYFNKQLNDFGDPAYASAAYNAGPAATQKAIKLAADLKRPELWTSFLPKETQDYVKKTAGSTTPNVPPEAPPLPPSGPLGIKNQSLPIIAAGALLGLGGVKGASGVTEFGKALAPNNVPAGGYQQDPATGKLTYVPDPAAQERLANEKTRLDYEQQRLEMERQRLNKPPEGYERTEGGMKPVKGGPAESKLTEAEGKATAYYSQMLEARKVLEDLQNKGWNPNSTAAQVGTMLAGGATNPLATEMQQQAKQAQEQWAEAYLRFKTGAATNADEIARNVRTFFPQIGDKAGNVKQKEQARIDAEKAMSITAGRGIGKLNEQSGLPAGSKQIGTSKGRPVYQTPDGKKLIME